MERRNALTEREFAAPYGTTVDHVLATAFDDPTGCSLAKPRHACHLNVLLIRMTVGGHYVQRRSLGSGTVARTERIPIHEWAEAAVIAWMRHQTTGYEQM